MHTRSSLPTSTDIFFSLFKFPSYRTCSSTLIELKYSLSYQLNSWLLVRQHFKSFHLLLGCYSCRWCVNRFIVSKFTFLFKYSLSENILASICLKTGISWTMNKKHVYMKRGASSPHNGLGDVLWLALMKPISKSINNGPTNRDRSIPFSAHFSYFSKCGWKEVLCNRHQGRQLKPDTRLRPAVI